MNSSQLQEGKKGRGGMVLAVVAVLALIAYAGYNVYRLRTAPAEKREDRSARPVAVTEVKRMALERWLDLTGEVRPWQEVHVYARVPGQKIEVLAVDRGQRLKKGDLIALLDRSLVDARMAEARAALAAGQAGVRQVEAELEVLEKDRRRFEALYAQKAVARQQLDHLSAKAQAASEARDLALAQTARAEATIRQLSIAVADHRIEAPIAGTVTARLFDPGNLSATDRPLIQLANETRVKIHTFVSEADHPALKIGMPAEVRIDADPERVFHGIISLINPVFDPATRNSDVEIHLDNPEGRLASGMFARVRLLRERFEATVVDRDALVRMAGTGSDYVFAVQNGRAAQINVRAGRGDERFVQIQGDLAVGQPVVIEGQGALRDGDRVVIRDAQKPAGKEAEAR
jgi:RND family efflux transporter MFP subunit